MIVIFFPIKTAKQSFRFIKLQDNNVRTEHNNIIIMSEHFVRNI